MIDVVAEKIAETIGVALLHTAIEKAYTDKNTLLAALSCSTLMRKAKIRVSMCQLLSLKIENRFVLIANQKRRGNYAPIGGVVRYFPWISDHLKGTIHYEQQKMSKLEERLDLRGFIYGRDFVPFLRWYFSSLGRERQAIVREIHEELIEIGVRPPHSLFGQLEFRTIRDVHEGPTKSATINYHQYRHFEILELEEQHGPSAALKAFIAEIASRRKSRFLLVTAEEIRKGRCEKGHLIADSSGYLFTADRTGAEPPSF